jgi:2-polyprenyl-3-methyl-5-hydroxy-6-metoxy-1,4-benzoquinol methylase
LNPEQTLNVQPGHYATKQLLSASRLVRWSHGSRFRLARKLVAPAAGGRLLDYGCGDGTFLGMVRDLFPTAIGADHAAEQIVDCTVRFAAVPNIAFITTGQLSAPEHRQRYDVVVCMEVLEHCPDDIQLAVLEQIQQTMGPGATLVVSVPIEIGPALLAKQSARALLARRGRSEYTTRERYRASELARLLWANAETPFPREEYTSTIDGHVSRFTGHKGFNWRALERRIEQRFTIERRLFSPLPMLGAWLNSQVWFVCQSESMIR